MVTRSRFIFFMLFALVLTTTGCKHYSDFAAEPNNADNPAHGNVNAGAVAIRVNGCTACHTIPGIRSSRGLVGPPLDHFANRMYIAGELPNNAHNLERWIQRPHDIHPHTVMPNMDLSDNDVRNIAAYLYTLR